MSEPSVGAEYMSATVKVKSAAPAAGKRPGLGVCAGCLLVSYAAASLNVQ